MRTGPAAGRAVGVYVVPADSLVRITLTGFLAGATLFIGLGVYLNAEIGAPALSNFGPMAILAVIGGTIGGLLAPLFRRRRP